MEEMLKSLPAESLLKIILKFQPFGVFRAMTYTIYDSPYIVLSQPFSVLLSPTNYFNPNDTGFITTVIHYL